MSRLLVFPLSTPSNGFKQFKQQPKQAAAEGTRRDDSPLREQGGPLVSSSACLLCQLSKYQGFQKVLILVPKHASLSLGNLIHLHRFNYYLLSEEYTGAIPGLSLKYQTLTFNDL